MQYFARIFNEMLNFYDAEDVADIATRFVESIYYDAGKKNHTTAKLVCYYSTYIS